MKSLRLGAALLLLGSAGATAGSALPVLDFCWLRCQHHSEICIDEGRESDEYCSGLFWGCYSSCRLF